MREQTIQIISNNFKISLLFDTKNHSAVSQTQEGVVRDFMDKEYYSEEWDRYDDKKTEHLSDITKHWDDIKFFEKKFDELKEKEMNEILTDFEKILLEVIDERLLAFPKGPGNPFYPDDHEQLTATKNEYKAVVNEFNKKHR